MKDKSTLRRGFVFKKYEAPNQSPFHKLFDIFKELITYTSGDFDEAISWLRELDKEYKLTTPEYTNDDFIEEKKLIPTEKEQWLLLQKPNVLYGNKL